jgi:hypothetical protein
MAGRRHVVDPNMIDVELWRRLVIEQPEAGMTRILAFLVSLAFLTAVLVLVFRGRLREEYTPIWTVVAAGIMILSLWFDAVRLMTWAVGAWTPSSTLFFFGHVFLLFLCLNYAVRLSGLTAQVKILAQEVSLLRSGLLIQRPTGDGPGLSPATPGGPDEGHTIHMH